jgi:FAD synthetase
MLSKNLKTKIMIFGTFDGLHQGHLNFFKQARKLSTNPFLIASIARDFNVKRIKGVQPMFSQRKRMSLVKKIDTIDKVILGGKDKYLPHILKERPNIIALGYDQKFYVKNLKKDLKKLGLSVQIHRLRPYKKHIFKNHLLKKRASV